MSDESRGNSIREVLMNLGHGETEVRWVPYSAWENVAKMNARVCPRCGSPSESYGAIISLDTLPPCLSAGFKCIKGHQWSIHWEGE